MRTEASQAGATCEVSTDFHQLSNLLIESSVTPSMQTNSRGTPRFDYYTDPMAAFSNDKRMCKGSYQNLPGSINCFPTPSMTPSPAHQVRPIYSPDPIMYQPRSPYYSSRPIHPETTPSPTHQVQAPYFPNPQMFHQPQNPYYNSGPRNPSISPSPSPAHHGQSGHFQARAPYHNSYANTPSPSLRGTPSSGRGRGRSGLGRGGNTGAGSHGSVSVELRPDLYYNKSMIEDPWKNLEPSIWKIEMKNFSTPDTRKNLNSDSVGLKKARILEASKESSSQPSLAEYLAAAFNESVGEESNKDKSIL